MIKFLKTNIQNVASCTALRDLNLKVNQRLVENIPKKFMQFIMPNFPLLNGPYSGRENPELLLPACTKIS